MKKLSHRYSQDASPAEMEALIDYDPETGVLRWRARSAVSVSKRQTGDPDRIAASWNALHAGRRCLNREGRGYLTGTVKERLYAAHRVAWAIFYGEWPAHAIDHIDGDRANNRIDNLRLANAETNARNRGVGVTNASGYLGVRWVENAQKWHASISDRYSRISLGYFLTKTEAVAARLGAERVLAYHVNHGKRPSDAMRRIGGGEAAAVHVQENARVAA